MHIERQIESNLMLKIYIISLLKTEKEHTPYHIALIYYVIQTSDGNFIAKGKRILK